MKNILLLPLLALVLSMTSCNDGDFGPGVRGTGPVESEVRSVNSFSRIEVQDHIDVVLTQGAQPEVQLEAQRNILEIVEATTSGDKLVLHLTRPTRGKSTKRVRAYITMPNLSEVVVQDHASVQSTASWSANTFNLRIKDHGTAELRFDQVEKLATTVADHGNLTLAGEVRQHEISGRNHASVRAFNLGTQDTKVSVNDHASAEVLAVNTLVAEARDHGSVTYKGRPTVSVRTSDHGHVGAAD
jgi:hypothetical protein